MTLPTRKKDNEIEWPRRVESTVPTIFAELILLSGTSVAKNELSQLKDVIFLAIKTHFCPVGQKVWYVYQSMMHAIYGTEGLVCISINDARNIWDRRSGMYINQ